MKPLLLSILLSIPCFADYRPDRDGASTTVGLDVVDMQGEPVEGAKVMFRVFTTFDKCYRVMRDTDKAGHCEITGKTRGEITVVATKDGCYTSYGSLKYRDLPWEDAVAEHRWTRGIVGNRITLKPVVNPQRHVSNGMTLKPLPVANQMLPFDAFVFDWCPPYGKGKVKDFEIGCYSFTNAVPRSRRGVRIRAVQCVDGFVLRDVDEWSKFRYALNADKDASYDKEIRFGWLPNDENGVLAEGLGFDRDKYMIFRIRSKTNEVGKIVSAYYGIIDEGLDFQSGLSLGVQVNPEDNDTSLEDDWAYRNMKKGR